MKPINLHDWQLSGESKMTAAQQRLFNAACGDLEQLNWHGNRLSKDDWRHLLSGTVLGWRTMPGIDMGEGRRPMVMLGGSSLDLSRSQATEAIQMAFYIGDAPHDQGLSCAPVQWSQVVRLARGISDSDEELSRRFAA